MHLFYVQGGGLGHLTRTDKLIQFLKIDVNEVIIITPSIFTHHFENYKFKKINWHQTPEEWSTIIENVIREFDVLNFYIDAFPFGIKGELWSVFKKFTNLNYVYVARILKWKTYLEKMPGISTIIFYKTIVLEDLYPAHLKWIESHSKQLQKVSLVYTDVALKPVQLMKEPYVVIVQSGGEKEVRYLCDMVEKDSSVKNCKIIVFTQVNLLLKSPRFYIKKSIYPVQQYFYHAEKIYTGAGFNCIQELKSYKEKHFSIAFAKMFDDQTFRKRTNNLF